VVTRSCNRLQLADKTGKYYGLKLTNFATSSEQTLRADRQAVTDADTELRPGIVLKLDDGSSIILARQEPDIYAGTTLRYTFDVIDPTHYVDVVRTTLIKNDQGGLLGKSDAIVITKMPGKVALRENVGSKLVDTYKSQYVLLISIDEDVVVGDRLILSGGHIEVAKVDVVTQAADGIKEVWFDKDPRWE
jgi:hypothetical protein